MTRSVKALLLSALVFPGAGHFFLKKPVFGAVLAGISVVCLCVLLATSMEVAQGISTKIQNGVVPLDADRIERELTKETPGEASLLNISTYVLEVCWLIGIVDSFRIGRASDKANR